MLFIIIKHKKQARVLLLSSVSVSFLEPLFSQMVISVRLRDIVTKEKRKTLFTKVDRHSKESK